MTDDALIALQPPGAVRSLLEHQRDALAAERRKSAELLRRLARTEEARQQEVNRLHAENAQLRAALAGRE